MALALIKRKAKERILQQKKQKTAAEDRKNVWTRTPLPEYWQMAPIYSTVEDAETFLWINERKKYNLCEVSQEEGAEIEEVMKQSWKGGQANFNNKDFQIKVIERVENPVMYKMYWNKQQQLLGQLQAQIGIDLVQDDQHQPMFKPVDKVSDSRGQVLTTNLLDPGRLLSRNIEKKINECYLFHGTKKGNVTIIARDGIDNRFADSNSNLGPGIYLAESAKKSDQYTGIEDPRQMFLVRVLLGEPYLHTDTPPQKFKKSPCSSCHSDKCSCNSALHHNSIIDDRLVHREFVVHEQCQCYPEYLITYEKNVDGPVVTRYPRPHPSPLLPLPHHLPPLPHLRPPLPLHALPPLHLLTLPPLPPLPPPTPPLPDECCARCFKPFLKIVVALLGVIVMLTTEAVPVIMVVFGRLYVKECPGMPWLSPYLTAMGASALALCLATPVIFFNFKRLFSNTFVRLVFAVLVVVPYVGSQGFGYAYLYFIANRYSVSTTNSTSQLYCQEFLLQLSLWSTRFLTVSCFVLCPLLAFLIWWISPTILKATMVFFAVLTSIWCILLFLAALALPVAFIILGVVNLNQCPSLPLVDVALIFVGSTLMLLYFSPLLEKLFCRCCCGLSDMAKTALLCALLTLIQHAMLWLVYERIYPYRAEEISQDPSSQNYCPLYLYEIIYTTAPFSSLMDFLFPFALYCYTVTRHRVGPGS